jgi:hypothetical protein
VPSEGLVGKSRNFYMQQLGGPIWQLTGPGIALNTSTTASSILYGSNSTTVITSTTRPSYFIAAQGNGFSIPAGGLLWGGNWPYEATPTSTTGSGHGLKMVLYGTFNTTSTPTVIMTVGLRADAVTATYTALGTTGTYTTAATTTQPWRLEVDYSVQTYAASSSGIIVNGLLTLGTASGTAGVVLPVSAQAPAVVTTLDLTAAYFPDVVVTWGTSSASNNIQVLGGYCAFLD